MTSIGRVKPSTLMISVCLVVLSVALGGCEIGDTRAAEDAENAALLVEIRPVEPASEYAVAREFIGRVEATRQSQMGFELPGELRAVLVDEGSAVSAGDLLARLDTARLEARLAEANAALDQANSAAEFATRSLQRNEEAAAFDGISAQELDLARDAANAANASANAATARVNTVKVDLAKSRLTAPYDATVVARHVDEGNIVAAGSPVLHLIERAAAEVRVGVSADHAATMKPGDTRTVAIGKEEVEATVRSVLPISDPSTRTVDVILQLPAGTAAVPGDLARLRAEQTVAEPGFWLPTNALAEGSRGLWTANVVRPLSGDEPAGNGATHVVEPRSVEVLYKQDTAVYVRGAIAEGDSYITGGMQRVVPYQQVRVTSQLAEKDTKAQSYE